MANPGARALQARLNNPAEDTATLAADARDLFVQIGNEAFVDWLNLELTGYGRRTEVRPLHEVLGVAHGDRLALQVAAYRTRVGHLFGSDGKDRPFPHFFVESLGDLARSAAWVRARQTTGFLELEFGPHAGRPDYPSRLEFPADVFDQVLLGFRATLHLRVAEIA
ncbi:MAG: hypothetical protein IT378_23945 [Sandaracinaceae bacterium]|nr:hypothetical protein [Sandaracinaceae bacterium]